MFSEISANLMMAHLPEGYEIITEGKLMPGDIRWNRWTDEWNLDDITTSPKHDCVIGDPISSFAGVCRRKANVLKQAV